MEALVQSALHNYLAAHNLIASFCTVQLSPGGEATSVKSAIAFEKAWLFEKTTLALYS
jgi:hypothetical protein